MVAAIKKAQIMGMNAVCLHLYVVLILIYVHVCRSHSIYHSKTLHNQMTLSEKLVIFEHVFV